MAASITEITRIQRLIKEFERLAQTEPAVHQLLQQIDKEYGGSHLLSLDALQGLDTERQQALADLLTHLIDKIILSQAFTKDEETKLQEIIRQANSQQQEVNLKREKEKQVGLELIEKGQCAIISLEAFNSLNPDRQKRLAILVGRECLQQRLSVEEQKTMKNLVQLADLRRQTAIIKSNTPPSPTPVVSSSSFFSGISSLFSTETKKSCDDSRSPQKK